MNRVFIPLPYGLIRLLAKYENRLSEIIMDGKLDTVLLSTNTETRKYTYEEIRQFISNEESPVTSLIVTRKFFLNGIYRYTLEEYTKSGKKMTVSCQEISLEFYTSLVDIFRL